MKTTEEREKSLRRGDGKNKTLQKIVLYLMQNDWSCNRISEYLGYNDRRVRYLSSLSIENHVVNLKAKPYDPNAVTHKWDDYQTEKDYMQMPLPNEWRLPMFK